MMNRRQFATGILAGFYGVVHGRADEGRIWPSEPPAGCPFAPSPTLTGIRFTGVHARYTNADTWYPSWASDGNLYSPWTDGTVNDVASTSFGKNPTTGHATILGDSPVDLKIVNAGIYPGAPAPYGGRYPCGSLAYNGVWYYGTYCLMDTDSGPAKGLNWPILGPFVGFRYSKDFGKTWTDTPHTPAKPLFGEPARRGGPVKIGAPHFVDFGKNMQHSPDGKAYLVAHGAAAEDPTPRPANLSWITGDQAYLIRVEPSIANINDPGKYEYFAGNRGERPVWSRRFADLEPLIEWDDRAGCATITYNAPLKKYLMCITDGGNTISRFNTYILESDAVTGPWKLVVFMKNFGEQAYFVNFPSKFIGAGGEQAWLLYAANFTNGYLKTNYSDDPPGGGYGMCLQQVHLLGHEGKA